MARWLRATRRLTWPRDGKLKTTDGIYGIRFSHNTEGTVTDSKMTKP